MDDGAFQLGVGPEPDTHPQHRVLAQAGTGVDEAVVAHDRRPGHHGGGVDLGTFGHEHAVGDLEAGDADLDPPVEDVLVRPHVCGERADVLPVALQHRADQLLVGSEQRREHVAREVDGPLSGDVVEHLRLEDVDARVDRVGEHLTPRRLLQEPFDGAVVAGDHDAVLERVLHPHQADRRQRAVIAVSLDDGAEIDVGEHVAGDHEERVIELVHRVSHRPGGAERRLLGRVGHAHAELRAVTEVVPDVVRHERHRDDDLVDPMALQQVDDVLHHRPVHQREHGLGRVRREGTESSALAPCHDHGLHGTPHIGWTRSGFAANPRTEPTAPPRAATPRHRDLRPFFPDVVPSVRIASIGMSRPLRPT